MDSFAGLASVADAAVAEVGGALLAGKLVVVFDVEFQGGVALAIQAGDDLGDAGGAFELLDIAVEVGFDHPRLRVGEGMRAWGAGQQAGGGSGGDEQQRKGAHVAIIARPGGGLLGATVPRMDIAVLGLGLIGSIWARHWQADGHAVRGWNRTPRPEHPCWCADLRVAVAPAALVAVVVSDAVAVRATLEAVADLLPGKVVAVHSTIGVDEAKGLAAQVRAWGGAYLDMPFTGSKPAAEARKNVFFVGDDADVFPRVEAVYERISGARERLGGVGSAATVKLSMNLLIAGMYQTLAEGFRLARRAGVDGDTFFRMLDLNIAKSGVSELKKPKLLSGDWAPQFSVKHMHKDLRLALRLAASLGQDLPLTSGVERSYQAAEAAGLADADFAALATTLGC